VRDSVLANADIPIRGASGGPMPVIQAGRFGAGGDFVTTTTE
jgi:hypothetical protein